MQDGIAPEKNPLVWDELKGSAVVTMGVREQAARVQQQTEPAAQREEPSCVH